MSTGEEDAESRAILDPVELDELREVFFRVAWQQYGGSGLNVTLGELEQMRVSDILWYLDRVQKERQAESDAMKRGSAKKAKK